MDPKCEAIKQTDPLDKFQAEWFSISYVLHNTVNLAVFSGNPVFQNAGDLLEWLTSKEKVPVNCDGSSQELSKLEFLFYENQSLGFRRGQSAICIGFPLIHIAFPGREKVSLPLFFWEIELERNATYFSEWLIIGPANKKALFNPHLRCLFSNDSESRLNKLLQDFIDGKFPAQSGLDAFYRRLKVLMPELQLPTQTAVLNLWPHLASSEHPSSNIWMESMALLGIFPYLNVPEIVSSELVLEAPINKKSTENRFFPLAADPYQHRILCEFGIGNPLIEVSGGPGTGKTHTLVNLALSALAEQKKCLIVAPGVAGLREIQDLMADLGLETLQYLLVNPANEGAYFKQFLKSKLEMSGDGKFSKEVQQWENELSLLVQHAEILNQRLKIARKTVFGKLNWPELAGMYLKSNKEAGKEYLESLISGKNFRFDEATYLRIKKSVVASTSLYANLEKLKSPLADLNQKIFLNQSREDAAVFVGDTTNHFKGRFIQLQQDFALLLADYKDALFAYYQGLYVSMKDKAESLEKDIASGLLAYGDYFLKAADGSLQFKGLLGGKYASLRKEKEYLIRSWEEFRKAFRETALADEGFSVLREHRKIGEIKESLQKFTSELLAWKSKLPELTQQECSRLSTKTMRPALDFLPRLEKLEAKLKATLLDLNASGLFEEPRENLMLSVVRMLDFLEDNIASIEFIEAEMPFFNPFFDWQRFWISQDEEAKEVIQALIRSKAPNWEKSFDSWFFYQVLVENSNADLPREHQDFASYVSRLDTLRDRFPAYLASCWQANTNSIPKAEKKMLAADKDKNKGIETAVSSVWFDAHFSAVTSLVPVLLLSQAAAASLLPGLSKTFDYVLVDNAGYLDNGMLELLANFGKQKVFFFDSGDHEGSIFSLNLCHRWPPGCLDLLVDPAIRLSEDALGNFKVSFLQTDGRFDQAHRINEAEAAQVLQILNEIEETPGRMLPRVVIAGFTKEQRNLLASYIDRIKRAELPGAEKIRQLERNGLRIVHPGELPGVHADILIVSLTYGPVNIKGDLPDAIEEINHPAVVRDLRLLSGRVLQGLFIVNSIPEFFFNKENLQHTIKSGKGFSYLVHYLAYAKSLSCQDSADQGIVVDSLRKSIFAERQQQNIEKETEGLMYDRIAEFLNKHYPGDRVVRNYRIGHFDFPLVLLAAAPAEKIQVILLDGFLSPLSVTDMEWEYKQGKLVAAYKMKMVETFAVHWFPQSDKAGEKLLKDLNAGVGNS